MKLSISSPSAAPSPPKLLLAIVPRAWTALAAALLLAVGAPAQFPATETVELTPGLAQFTGRAVAIHGDVLFLGAPADLSVGTPRFVHAYRLIGGQWTLEQTLTPDPLDDGRFGFALDFDGTTLVVGSPPLPKGGHGRATVFTHEGASWVGSALTYPPAIEPAIGYGHCVAVDGSSILVGAPLADVSIPGQLGEDVGVAYGYRRTAAGTWTIKQKVVPSSPANNLAFGISVDISGDHALIGTGSDRVHALHFSLATQWAEVQVLTPSLATPNSSFGEAVSLSGDRAVVGAWQDQSFAESGAAFIFERACGQWTESQRLAAKADASTYGRAVGISGDVVIVSASGQDVGADLAGAGYAYRWDGVSFELEQTLHAAVPAVNDQLGVGVALSGDRAVLGAPGASALPGGSGFVFDAVAVTSPWTNLGHSLAGTTTPELHGTGTLQPGSPLELTLGCGPAGAAGALFVGLGELLAPFKGGVLVPQPLIVLALQLDGSGGLSLQATWPATAPADTTVTLQAWLLDAGGPQGLSASNGVRASSKP